MLQDKSVKLLASFEGFRALAYDDLQPKKILKPGDTLKGTLTIGYGHTGKDVFIGKRITQEEAWELKRKDTLVRFQQVKKLVAGYPTTADQLDAMVILAYNIGVPEFEKSSSVFRLHKKGDFIGAANSFRLYNLSKGIRLAPLVRRRFSEALLYSTGKADPLEHISGTMQEWEKYAYITLRIKKPDGQRFE